jgi:hypothetical protein
MKSRKLLVAATVSLLLVLLWLVLLPLGEAPEPEYQGKPLKVWLEDFDNGQGSAKYREAQTAIRAMGTNSLPFLIRYLLKKDPPFHIQRIRLMAKLHLLRGKAEYAQFWHQRAAHACAALGRGGIPAFPAMMEAMNDQPSMSDVGPALANMLPDSAPTLTNVLATGHHIARCRAADALMTAFSHPGIEEMSRTALLNALRDPDAGVRMSAASALQSWNKRLDLVVPALTAVLSDTNASVRGNAATALGQLGPAAKSAVPEIIKLLQDTNSYPVNSGQVRDRAKWVLKRIDPESAAHGPDEP